MTALFVAPDGYGDPTIWRRDSDDDRLPQPILSRTAANARGFEELAALVEGAAASRQRCSCDPVPMSCNGEGPSETCEIHGRDYHEWVERGDILAARLAAVKEVIAKAQRTPVANDPYRVAIDIADDLEAAVYLDALPGMGSVDDLRAALTAPPAPAECCASGRCEVCSPGFDWGRDG